MDVIKWNRVIVEPADILDGLKSIASKNVWTHTRTPEGWLAPETLFEWATIGMNNNNELGWDVAVSYAKRAVCRRIDGFLANNWLAHFENKKYPEKIKILSEIGIPIPGIVHRFVIGSRNEIEHDYKAATKDEAENAIDVAQLMLLATANESPRVPVVLAGGDFESEMGIKASEPRFENHKINSLGTEPMVFVDFLENPIQVKLIYPGDQEIRYSNLLKFKMDEVISFGKTMRTYRDSDIMSGSFGLPKELLPTVRRFEEFKKQTGI
jgi:hypothetical protein